MTFKEKFWSKVDKTGDCWLWLGIKDKRGYGSIYFNGRHRQATHISWYLTYNSMPEHNMLHKCDNTSCVNPEHLFDGNQKVNMLDKVSKNRQNKGETHPMSILTEHDVLQIREKLSNKVMYKYIAEEFKVSMTTISDISTRKLWKHI